MSFRFCKCVKKEFYPGEQRSLDYGSSVERNPVDIGICHAYLLVRVPSVALVPGGGCGSKLPRGQGNTADVPGGSAVEEVR